jgi:8-oxo-dGTP diphosphatase
MNNNRFQCVIAAHLFLIKRNKILLLKRKNTGFCDGMFSVPAGHLDERETIIEAIIREAREETTLVIKKKDLLFIQVMHRDADDGERIDFFFEAGKWQNQIKIGEPGKCSQLYWSEINHLPLNIVPYIKFAIKKYLKKEKLTFFGWER